MKLTFKNVSSNILHNDKGEPALLDVVLKITPENINQVHQAYRKTGQLTVEIYLNQEQTTCKD